MAMIPQLPVFKEALDGLAQRHDVLVTNLANMHTPGYTSRDVDFKSVMQGLQSATSPMGMATTDAQHLLPPDGTTPWERATFNTQEPVELRHEMVALSENNIHYAALVQSLQQQFSRYRMVVREGK